ncbi:MAG: hypothetical protein ACUVSK_13750, partial [Desulfotomaculales bacterium]
FENISLLLANPSSGFFCSTRTKQEFSAKILINRPEGLSGDKFSFARLLFFSWPALARQDMGG